MTDATLQLLIGVSEGKYLPSLIPSLLYSVDNVVVIL